MVDVCDPWVNAEDVRAEYGLNLVETPANGDYDAIIIAVAHDQFKALGASGIRAYGKANHVIYDIKYLLDSRETDGRL